MTIKLPLKIRKGKIVAIIQEFADYFLLKGNLRFCNVFLLMSRLNVTSLNFHGVNFGRLI